MSFDMWRGGLQSMYNLTGALARDGSWKYEIKTGQHDCVDTVMSMH